MMKQKLKKLLAILAVAALGCSLAACGSSTSTETEGDTAETETSDSEAAATESETSTENDGETIVLKAISGYSESELPSQTLVKFLDLVEEKTDGQITFERYLGGTFCTIPEEFDYVSSGSVGVIMLLPDMQIETMSLWSVGFKDIGESESMDLFNEIAFENEETAALLEEQATENGVKILGGSAAGLTIHMAKSEITSLEDLSSMLYGTTGNSETYTALGLSVQYVENADMYESLDRGVINSCGATISLANSLKLYEVAPYGLISNVADVTPMICFNLEAFDSLSEELQEIVFECAQEASQWSLEQSEAMVDETVQIIEDAGGVVNYLSTEDDEAFLEENAAVVREQYGAIAEEAGYGDAFTTLMDAIEAAR